MKCTAGFIGTLVIRTNCYKLDLVQRWKTHLPYVTNVESETFEPFFLDGAHNEYLSSIMNSKKYHDRTVSAKYFFLCTYR